MPYILLEEVSARLRGRDDVLLYDEVERPEGVVGIDPDTDNLCVVAGRGS